MTVPSLILAHTPVLYYRLGETGTDNPVDSSPSGIGGILGGGYTWGEPGALYGDADTALLLSGGDFFVSTRVALTGDQTRLAWTKTTSTNATAAYDGDAALTVMGDNTGLVWDGFGITGGFVECRRFNNSTWQTFTGSTPVNDGEWHMIAVTYDSTTRAVILYVDGVADGGGTVTAHQSQGGIRNVGRGYNASDVFVGTLDEVAAFASVLTGADIEELWVESGGTPPPELGPGHLTAHGGTLTLSVITPPALDAGHTVVHGGTLAITTSTVVVDAGHLTVHGGAVNTFAPASISAGHTVIHGGVIVSGGTPPIEVSSDGLAGGEWDDGVIRDLAPQPPEPEPIVVPLPTWANR